jgi:hypothetical protein
MNVGGNLTVESLQSTESASSRSYGLSGTFSSSEKGLKDNKTKSRDGSGGGSFNISRTESRWVNHQTALTGGTVDVYVEKRTTLAGAVIASDTEDLKLSTGSFEYSDIKDRKISWNYGGGGSLGTDLNSGNRKNERNNSFSLNAEYGFSDKRQTNFATIGNGEITVRGAPAPLVADGDIFLPGLNRKVPMAQYGIVDAGLKGQMLVDMSTVEMTGSPVKTLSDTGKAISQGWDAASNSIGEIWKESRVLYQKTNNYIDYNHFSTDNDAELYLDSKYILVKSKEFLLERLGFDPEENFNLFKDRILSDRLEYYSYKLVLGEKFLENEMKDFDYIGRTYLSGIKIDPESNFMEYNKAIFQFPMSGKGFVNSANLKYNPEIHKYGTYGTIMTLANAMEKWSATGNYPMLINDLDLLNEAPSSLHHNVPHRGVDINLSGTDGSFVHNYTDLNYDRTATRKQIGIILESTPYNYEIQRILYNDPAIERDFDNRKNSFNKQVIQELKGHDNHYHIEVRSKKFKRTE